MLRVMGLLSALAACGAHASDDSRRGDDPLAAAIQAGDFPRTTSAIVYQHGAPLYEHHFGGTGVDTLHDVRSVTNTIADLMTMSSALDCDDDVPDSPGNEEKMYPQRVWTRWAADLPLRDTTGFAYCTAGAFLIGQIVERATGQPIDRYLETRRACAVRLKHATRPSHLVMGDAPIRAVHEPWGVDAARATTSRARRCAQHGDDSTE